VKRMRQDAGECEIDRLYSELVLIGENVAGVQEFCARHELSESVLLALLRRAVPHKFLEHVVNTRPWSERSGILGAAAMNPRVPRHIALRLVSALTWVDLARLAVTPRVDAAVRSRCEEILNERLPDMRLGERVALARRATPRILMRLLLDDDPKIIDAGLLNPRLREEDVLYSIRREGPSRTLLGRVTECFRWRDNHAIRLALVLQPRTPLSVALTQLSHLLDSALAQLAVTTTLPPLVRAGAERVLEERSAKRRGQPDEGGIDSTGH
jgi:hypothetical protein